MSRHPSNTGLLKRYEVEIDIWQRAKDSAQGIRVFYPNRGAAIHASQRLYRARSAIRRDNEALPADNPLCGCSYYDGLKIPRPEQDSDGRWSIIIVPLMRDELEILEL